MPELPELSLVHTTSNTQRQSHTIPFISKQSWQFPDTGCRHAWRHKKVEICFESDNQLEWSTWSAAIFLKLN